MTYVELHAHSAYSFLDGASQPEELAARAAELGYEALALTDHDGVYGSLEFAHAAKSFGVRPITGAGVTLAGGSHVTLLVESPRGYANLCRLLTAAHAGTRSADMPRDLVPPKLDQGRLEELNDGLVCLSGCARHGLAESLRVETVVTGDPHAHARSRVGLQDALVAIRNRTSLEGAERERRGNHESVLLAPAEIYERFPDDERAVARTVELAAR